MDTEPLHPTTAPLTRDIAPHTRTSLTLDDEEERTHLVGGKLPHMESFHWQGIPDDDGRTAPAPSVVDEPGRSADIAEAELTSMVSTALRVDTKMCHRADIFSVDEHGSGCKAKRISPSYEMPKVGGHHHHSSDETERGHLANNNYPIPTKQGKFASDGSSFSPYRNDDYLSHAITPVSTWDGSLAWRSPAISSKQPDTPSIHPPAVHHRGNEDEDDEDLELAWIQSSKAPAVGGGSPVISPSARPSGRRNPVIPGDENAVVPPFFERGSLSLPSPSFSKQRMSSQRDSSSQFWGAAGRTNVAARRRSSSSGGIRGILLDATNVRPREFEPVVGTTTTTTPREKTAEDARSPTSIATTTRGGGGTTAPGGGAAGRRRRARAGFF